MPLPQREIGVGDPVELNIDGLSEILGRVVSIYPNDTNPVEPRYMVQMAQRGPTGHAHTVVAQFQRSVLRIPQSVLREERAVKFVSHWVTKFGQDPDGEGGFRFSHHGMTGLEDDIVALLLEVAS